MTAQMWIHKTEILDQLEQATGLVDEAHRILKAVRKQKPPDTWDAFDDLTRYIQMLEKFLDKIECERWTKSRLVLMESEA